MCEVHQICNVLADVMKMKLFPNTLRDRVKDSFFNFEKEFTSSVKREEEFLRKYYAIRKTNTTTKN